MKVPVPLHPYQCWLFFFPSFLRIAILMAMKWHLIVPLIWVRFIKVLKPDVCNILHTWSVNFLSLKLLLLIVSFRNPSWRYHFFEELEFELRMKNVGFTTEKAGVKQCAETLEHPPEKTAGLPAASKSFPGSTLTGSCKIGRETLCKRRISGVTKVE